MNNTGRRTINSLVAKLEGIDISNLAQEVSDLQAEEQDKYDGLSEGLQATPRGEAIEAAADALQEALDLLEEINNCMVAAAEALQRAAE